MEEFDDLNDKYQNLQKRSFEQERLNDELVNKELAEMRNLRILNEELKHKNDVLDKKLKVQKNNSSW